MSWSLSKSSATIVLSEGSMHIVLDSMTGRRRFGQCFSVTSKSQLSSLISLTVLEYSVAETLLTLILSPVTWHFLIFERWHGPGGWLLSWVAKLLLGYTSRVLCEHLLALLKSLLAWFKSSISYWSLRAVRITKLHTPLASKTESGRRTFSCCKFSQSTSFLKLG